METTKLRTTAKLMAMAMSLNSCPASSSTKITGRKTATVVKRLPKTRSGKILRGTIQKIADNKPYKTPATIDDPVILEEMEEALTGIGFAKAKGED